MKTLIKTFALSVLALLLSCKKKETKEEPSAPPTPIGTTYSTFTPSLAIVDYTAPAPVRSYYSSNLSATTTAMAYIVADGERIDSLPLKITRIADLAATPTTTWAPDICDKEQWEYFYSTNTKSLKLKNGTSNYLKIYEDGIRIISAPIIISGSSTGLDVADTVTSSSYIRAQRCPNFLKFVVIH